MSEPRALVEHFFRHEFGRLDAVLTRSLGVRRQAFAGAPASKTGTSSRAVPERGTYQRQYDPPGVDL